MNSNKELLLLATLCNKKKALMELTLEMNKDNTNDSDDEEELIYKIKHFYKNQKVRRIDNYIVGVVNFYDEVQFQQNFRLKRIAFDKLLELITPHMGERQSSCRQLDVKHQLLAVIWLLATPDSYRSVSERFNMPKSMLSKCFVRIINALNGIIGEIIKWPAGSALEATKAKFASMSIFENLIGAVDGTYVALSVPKHLNTAYTNRKCFTSMTLQAICNSEMRYIDVYTGWPSSVPDIRVFKNSHVYEAAQEDPNRLFPNGEYILGDKAYPLLDWCITPFMDRGLMSSDQITFNKRHSSCRQVIERSFALLFGRFRRLRKLDMHRTDWVPSTITACCVLHNICLKLDCDIIENYITEGLPSQNNNTTEDRQQGGGSIQNEFINNGSVKRNNIIQNMYE